MSSNEVNKMNKRKSEDIINNNEKDDEKKQRLEHRWNRIICKGKCAVPFVDYFPNKKNLS